MSAVYVVMGSDGEYSDRTEWSVAAYLNRSNGERHVLALEEQLRVWQAMSRDEREALAGKEERTNTRGETYMWQRRLSCSLDKNHDFSPSWFDSPRYWLDEVELLEEVPT